MLKPDKNNAITLFLDEFLNKKFNEFPKQSLEKEQLVCKFSAHFIVCLFESNFKKILTKENGLNKYGKAIDLLWVDLQIKCGIEKQKLNKQNVIYQILQRFLDSGDFKYKAIADNNGLAEQIQKEFY